MRGKREGGRERERERMTACHRRRRHDVAEDECEHVVFIFVCKREETNGNG